MAPTAPKKRTSLRAKVSKKSQDTDLENGPSKIKDHSFFLPQTKHEKQELKRVSFRHEITAKARTSTGAGVKKRRRPSKKLVTNLDSLADALPELADDDDEEEWNGFGDKAQPGKVRIKSLRSRPGALKRKEKLVRKETEDMRVRLALLSRLETEGQLKKASTPNTQAGTTDGARASGQTEAPAPPSTANRWAALRAHISSTMEQNPAFVGKS